MTRTVNKKRKKCKKSEGRWTPEFLKAELYTASVEIHDLRAKLRQKEEEMSEDACKLDKIRSILAG